MGKELSHEDLCKILKKNVSEDELNLKLYSKAFIHKSSAKEKGCCNERLEFVGDAVLNVVIGHYLYEKFSEENEGFLTRVRTKLVSGPTLSKLASQLEFNNFMIMNEKAMRNQWYNNPRILEDAFESFIGALFIDKGFETCKRWILDVFNREFEDEHITTDTNYKDILMKAIQSKNLGQPEYKIFRENGPDHEKDFTVQVFVNGLLLSTGFGNTKKKAEQSAAYKSLQGLGMV